MTAVLIYCCEPAGSWAVALILRLSLLGRLWDLGFGVCVWTAQHCTVITLDMKDEPPDSSLLMLWC
jgi:hypothetical protein